MTTTFCFVDRFLGRNFSTVDIDYCSEACVQNWKGYFREE